MATIQTRLFQEFDPTSSGNELFVRDLKRLLELSPATLDLVFSRLPQILVSRTTEGTQDLLQQLTDQVNESGINVRGAINALSFFASRLARSKFEADSPRDLAADLRTLKLIDQQQQEVLETALARLHGEILPSYKTDAYRQQVSAGVGPSFSGLGATVELRAIQEKRYEPTQSVSEYEPDIRDVVGVASIVITTNDPQQSRFFFQADAEELELIINALKATQMDLRALESFCKQPTSPERK